jgi:rubrerythrin
MRATWRAGQSRAHTRIVESDEPPERRQEQPVRGELQEEELAGDPVCWLRMVYPECGTMVESEPPATCPRCGTLIDPGR